MKKIFYKLFVGIGVVLMLFYYTITAALCYPFHSLKYRRSAFFQETGIPFSAAKDTSDLRFFQIFREAGIPIRYLPPKDLKRSNGWFLLGRTLLLHMFDELSYSEKLQSWTLFPDDTLSLADTVANQLQCLREIHPNVEIGNIQILLDRIEVDPELLNRAQQDPLFVIYDNMEDLPKLLRDHNII